MFYPEETVEEVRARNNIVDVISAYVKLKRSGANLFGLCPFHSEKSASFSVSPSKQIYYCFGCGAGGNVISFVMQYDNCSFQEAVKTLADRAGIALPEPQEDEEARRARDLRTRILEVNRTAAGWYYYQLRSQTGRAGMDYLKGRGLSDETLHSFGLGYAPAEGNLLYMYLKGKGFDDRILSESGLMVHDERRGMYDKFRSRVIFPIMDTGSRVIGFGGRVMGDGKPKYLNSPETRVFDKGRNLYGLNIARSSRKKELILCEGYMDVIAMHQAGFTNAVASLGTSLTLQHANLIKRYVSDVVLSYDSDGAGVRAAMRAIPILREAGVRARVLNLSPYKDPDEFIRAEGTDAFAARIGAAEGSFFFEMSVMERDYNMEDPEQKTAFFRAVAEKIAGFEEEVERENYIEAAARRYQVSFEGLRRMVGTELMRGIRQENVSSAGDFSSGAGRGRTAEYDPGTEGEGEIPSAGRTGQRRGRMTADEGIRRAQSMLLTWLTEYPSIYPVLKEYVPVEYYTGDVARKTAAMLYAQAEQGQINPARIISAFEDPQDQREAALLFETKEPGLADEELKKAMRETIRKVAEAGQAMEAKSGGGTDLQKIIETKKKTERLAKLDIPL